MFGWPYANSRTSFIFNNMETIMNNESKTHSKTSRRAYAYAGNPWGDKKNARKFYAIYGLFRAHKETGAIEGFVEESFSMDFSKLRVRVMQFGDAEYNLKSINKSKKDEPYNYFICRVSSIRGQLSSVAKKTIFVRIPNNSDMQNKYLRRNWAFDSFLLSNNP